MKLFLSKAQFDKIKNNMGFIFTQYNFDYNEKEEILVIDVPSYEDIDYTKYMKNLKAVDRINFCIDALNFAI